MPLNAAALLAYRFPVTEHVVDERDVMLFALSLGVARDGLDARELPYVCETLTTPLRMFPTMPVVLGHPGNWRQDPALRITVAKIVQGGQRLKAHGVIRPGQRIRVTHRVTEVVDKGADKGALLVLERSIVDALTAAPLATMEWTSFCRADGGCGGPATQSWVPRAVPERAPDLVEELQSERNTALLYRLNADRTPMHADPAAAQRAGFARPILQGLATYGIAALGLMRALDRFDEGGLTALEGRFAKPVLPGDTLRLEAWQRDDGWSWRVRVPERDQIALDQGFATFGARP